MQFRDLKKQYDMLKPDIDNAISNVIEKSEFIMGPAVKKLEDELALYAGTKHCISCGSGTDALILALLALGIKKGDAVFVPDFTFFASAGSVLRTGATPVLIDVDEETYNMDHQKLDAKIQEVIREGILQPRAVITVDLFGLPADYEKLMPVADKYSLKIIEDGAQAFGGRINDKRVCSFGDIGATSFFPAKPLGCFGDGGAVFTDNDRYAEGIRSYRIHGKGENKYDNIRSGFNSRLDTIQAAVLGVKLKAFREYELDAVNKTAKKYSNKLKDLVKVPYVPANYHSAWAQYTICFEDEKKRDNAMETLKRGGIPTMIYYRKPLHFQKALENTYSYNTKDCIKTEKLCQRVLSLPIHPYLSDEDIEKVTSVLIKSINNE